jgi:hypothetical protein
MHPAFHLVLNTLPWVVPTAPQAQAATIPASNSHTDCLRCAGQSVFFAWR